MGNFTSEPERKGRDLSIEQGQERHSSTEETAKAKARGLKEMGRLRNQQGTCSPVPQQSSILKSERKQSLGKGVGALLPHGPPALRRGTNGEA